ncbi:MAG: hypothetical protein NZ899_11630 [Thermoguttaceae bacterium]|nr:hypothetical protein [Thermoguttaceae bacterium]MDW8079511.1 hypothetical protein [Thermoguttaceae bacterium]
MMYKFSCSYWRCFSTVAVLVVMTSVGCQFVSYIWQKQAMERVLQDYAKVVKLPISVRLKARALQYIDLTGCPEAFALAFLNHCRAWQMLAELEYQMRLHLGCDVRDFRRAREYDLLPTVRGPQGAVFKQMLDQVDQELLDTWQRVQRVAAAYGVKSPL